MEMARKVKDAAQTSGRLPSVFVGRPSYLGQLQWDNNSYVLLHPGKIIRPTADHLKCRAIILARRGTGDRIGG
jgi:hypothetical protein